MTPDASTHTQGDIIMTLTAAIAVIIGAVASLLTAIVTRPGWSPTRKRWTALTVAAVLGLITAVVTGQVEGIPSSVVSWVARIVVTVAIVIVSAQGIYAQFKDAMRLVEASTSPTLEPDPVPERAIPDGLRDPDGETYADSRGSDA